MNIGQIEVAHGVDTFQLSFVGKLWSTHYSFSTIMLESFICGNTSLANALVYRGTLPLNSRATRTKLMLCVRSIAFVSCIVLLQSNTFHIFKGLSALPIFLGVCKEANIYLTPLEPFINFIWCQAQVWPLKSGLQDLWKQSPFLLVPLIAVKPTSGVLSWLAPVLMLFLCFGPLAITDTFFK